MEQPTVTLGMGTHGFTLVVADKEELGSEPDTVKVTVKKPEEEGPLSFYLILERGLNSISLPLKPAIPYTARTLMDKIGSTTVIRLNPTKQKFEGFTIESDGDGFPIEGGAGYIVSVQDAKVVKFTGTAWTNEPPIAAPSNPILLSAWAFVVSGSLSIDILETASPNYKVTVTNLRTGSIVSDIVNAQGSGQFDATWVNLNRQSIIEVGDVLQIDVTDSEGRHVLSPIERQITADDIGKAFVHLHLKVGKPLPLRSALLPNFPNPFNPETWIPFNLKETSEVAITIYDINGRVVRILELGQLPAGIYQMKSEAGYWDGTNDIGEYVGSGIYFYRFQAGNFSALRKMAILK